MTTTSDVADLSWDLLIPGMLRSLLTTTMDCNYEWPTNCQTGVFYVVICTRDVGHLGQHVAEDLTHVIAVHPQ